MRMLKQTIAALTASSLILTNALLIQVHQRYEHVYEAETASIENNMEWGTLQITGGGFVSGIVTGQEVMYARTDVGGAYKYNFETKRWEQLMSFITEQGKGSIVVADVGSDNFQPLSDDLPDDCFPARISKDANGDFLITYVATITFGAGNGGIYRYDPDTGAVEDISPEKNSFGACMSAPDNANELIATTCGVWSIQRWDDTGEHDQYGEWLYRSEDGGKTWTSIYPGKQGDYVWDPETGDVHPTQLYDYLRDDGCSWVYGKAIHWSGALVLNPQNPGQIMVSSGNGVFQWNDIWSDYPVATFHAKGIEEVVAHDFVSIPGGDNYSVIYDYDGFRHRAVDQQGEQFQPNMGSTLAIAYCPQNPDVLVRYADKTGQGYYTMDGGDTWTEMSLPGGGGKAAITQMEDGTYRIFKSEQEGAGVSYTDDFGKTWNQTEGIKGSKTTYMLVEPENPAVIYAYTTQYNSWWAADKTKTEPTFEDAHYSFYISTDYGKTFTGSDIARYDECDQAGRIAYLSEDNLMVGAGWYGMYHITNGGQTIEKNDVYYCKSIGYGAQEKEGDLNTLYMWGKPQENDREGIYRSQDGGETWVAINTTKHYGGTGNGNFIVGDMNEFGTVYISTVGMGIVYGRLSDGKTDPPVTPTEPDEPIIGDISQDGKLDKKDIQLLQKYLLNEKKLSKEQAQIADLNQDGAVNGFDLALLRQKK